MIAIYSFDLQQPVANAIERADKTADQWDEASGRGKKEKNQWIVLT